MSTNWLRIAILAVFLVSGVSAPGLQSELGPYRGSATDDYASACLSVWPRSRLIPAGIQATMGYPANASRLLRAVGPSWSSIEKDLK